MYYKCYYEMHGFWGGVTTTAGAASLRETASLMEQLLGGKELVAGDRAAREESREDASEAKKAR